MIIGGVVIHVTAVGVILLVVSGLMLFMRPSWLVPLLIVCAILHAPAVAILKVSGQKHGLGISPWVMTSAVAMLHFAWLMFSSKCFWLDCSREIKRLLASWWAYAFIAVLTAFILPYVMEGVFVYSPANRRGADADAVPLVWTIVNAMQAFNVMLYVMLLLYLARVSCEDGFVRRMASGFAVAIMLSALLILCERGVYSGVLPKLSWFKDSLNPFYVQSHGAGLSIPRLSWPFSEPSYAGAWFAGVYAGGLALMLLTPRWLTGALCALASALGLLNAFGMAGIGSAVILSLVIGGLTIGLLLRSGPLGNTHWLMSWPKFAATMIVIAVGVCFALTISGLGSPLEIWHKLALPRLHGVDISGAHRARANWHALDLLVETWGLGVGLGSNRGSSYLLNLFASLGVVPALAFLCLVAYQAWLILSRGRRSAFGTFLLWGGVGTFVAVTLGVSDLNWPGWWIWILCSFALVSSRQIGPDSSGLIGGCDLHMQGPSEAT